jgi:peptidoglycan/xylan/chitin deacetylase (PgdA/CDA1 family)
MKKMMATALMAVAISYGCKQKAILNGPPKESEIRIAAKPPEAVKPPLADAATIISRPQVPILCYHQLRDWRPSDGKVARDYIVPPPKFADQVKALADSGYHAILPDQLMDYLQYGTPLPSKPFMITFDDTDETQYNVGLPVLEKYGFKGVFFIMTVSINRPRYMSKEQIKALADKGHVIASHTWDHHNVKKYTDPDWPLQLEKPSKQLEAITGKKIEYFAYPFGLWNPEAIPHLKTFAMKAAFQLSDKRDPADPLHSIRRMIVPGVWNGQTMLGVMGRTFRNS